VISRDHDDVRWWTWAGFRANATLAATLSDLTDGSQRFTDTHLRMRADLTPEMWKAATTDAAERLCLPEIDRDALTGLKFTEALPEHLPPPPSQPGWPTSTPQQQSSASQSCSAGAIRPTADSPAHGKRHVQRTEP
jgi:hypothetical protein